MYIVENNDKIYLIAKTILNYCLTNNYYLDD